MSHELYEGVKLRAVYGVATNAGDQLTLVVGDGSRPWHCSEIVVADQIGAMSMVPWAKATKSSGEVVLVNLAVIESVELAP